MLTPLNLEEIRETVPSIFAEAPHPDVSDKYSFIPTTKIIDLLSNKGWNLFEAQQVNSQESGFQKHMLRFYHEDLFLGDEAINLLLLNSHDRSVSYSISLGIFRFVCTNGLIIGDTFKKFQTKHMMLSDDDIIEAHYDIISSSNLLSDNITGMKESGLNNIEKQVFAESAKQLAYNDRNIFPEQLLEPRRESDNDDSIWTTYNVVQENIIKGGITYYTDSDRKQTTNPIKAIGRNFSINKNLYDMANSLN